MEKYSYYEREACYFDSEVIGNWGVSLFRGFKTHSVCCNMSLKNYLTTIFGCDSTRELCSRLRETDKKSNKVLYYDIKSRVMTATISCACSDIRDKSHICIRYPLICLDFDAQDNNTLYDDVQRNKVIEELYKWEYSYAVGTSCSGKGIFCIVPLCSNDNDNDFLGYFYSLQEIFRKSGFSIDKNCNDVTRLRNCSAEKPLVKTKCNVLCWRWQQWPVVEHHPIKPVTLTNPNATINDYTLSVELLNMLINSPASFNSYDEWYKLGFILAPLGSLGYQIFDSLSAQSSNYGGRNETYRKWQQTAPKSNKTITDTVRFAIGMAKQYIGKNAVLQAKVNILKRKKH